MDRRLTFRRATLGPRHSLVAPSMEKCDSRPLKHRLAPDAMQQLLEADTETMLLNAVESVFAFAITIMDHRQVVADLDNVWPQTKSCRSLNGDGSIVTLTTTIVSTVRKEMQLVVEQTRGRLVELALFSFVAELCWANFISPSEQSILRALRHFVDASGGQLSERLDVVAFFLNRVGPILSRNPLENFTVLLPLMHQIESLCESQPLRTRRFIAALLKRSKNSWAGSIHLDVDPCYWIDLWSSARLVLIAQRKDDPKICPLAALPPQACDLIAEGLCPKNRFETVIQVWVDESGLEHDPFSPLSRHQ